jgi:glycosyltransferase involved in cell wall biosynthesis
MSESASPPPLVSVILPTYNRARFLPQAFASIRAQTVTDWELIVVDDGSTDDTAAVVDRLRQEIPQSVCYFYQENQGPAEARNAGIGKARGRYLAFFDSDDEWLPHHLLHCTKALEENPWVDWIYAACRIVEEARGQVTVPNTFYVDGSPRPFLRLRTQAAGALRVLDDPGSIECQIRHGLYCGLQASVIRARLFETGRIPSFRVGEDQALAILALAKGYRLGYFDKVHAVYHVHGDNLSSAGSQSSLARRLKVYQELIDCHEYLRRQVRFSAAEAKALRQRLNQEYFWHVGYSLLWQNGRRDEALAMFRRGLGLWPWSWRCWKTYLLALCRSRLPPKQRNDQVPDPVGGTR